MCQETGRKLFFVVADGFAQFEAATEVVADALEDGELVREDSGIVVDVHASREDLSGILCRVGHFVSC